MSTSEIFSKTAHNAALLATFVTASAALIVGRKGIMWAGNKAYNIGVCTGKAMTGPTSAGILAGTAISMTYKYSAIAARHQFPIQKPGHEIGNRSIVMMTSVFALTALAIRRLNSKFSSHQMSLIGALSYASIATVASIFAVGITSDDEIHYIAFDDIDDTNAFYEYCPRAWELLSGAFTSDTSDFGAEMIRNRVLQL